MVTPTLTEDEAQNLIEKDRKLKDFMFSSKCTQIVLDEVGEMCPQLFRFYFFAIWHGYAIMN